MGQEYRQAGTVIRRPVFRIRLSGRSVLFDLAGLFAAAFAVVFQNEAHLVAFVQRVDAGELQRAGMNEYVLGAVFGGNEAKALGAIEEFYCSRDSHSGNLSLARE